MTEKGVWQMEAEGFDGKRPFMKHLDNGYRSLAEQLALQDMRFIDCQPNLFTYNAAIGACQAWGCRASSFPH